MTQTLSPEQLNEEGKAAYEREEYLEAAKAFEAAAKGFISSGDILAAAEADNNRSVTLLQAGEAESALEAVGNTPETFADANDMRRQAMALGNKAAALAALNRREDAEKAYWESARLLEEVGDTELRASVMNAISRLQMRSGRYLEAITSMQSGLDKTDKLSITQRILKKLLQILGRLLNKS